MNNPTTLYNSNLNRNLLIAILVILVGYILVQTVMKFIDDGYGSKDKDPMDLVGANCGGQQKPTCPMGMKPSCDKDSNQYICNYKYKNDYY